MAGTDTSSLLEILQVYFGCVASWESDEEESVLDEEEKTSEVAEEVIAKPLEAGNFSTVGFPFQVLPSCSCWCSRNTFTSPWSGDPFPLSLSSPLMYS